MFEKARELILTDRTAARKAMADEIKRDEKEALDAELDALEAEERERQEAEEEARARADAQRAAREERRDCRARQHAAAKKFDDAMAAASAAFGELEELANETTRLEREAGDDGKNASVKGHARSTALVSAAWNSARPLCQRVGLRVVPGGPSKIRPLTAIYPSTKGTDE